MGEGEMQGESRQPGLLVAHRAALAPFREEA